MSDHQRSDGDDDDHHHSLPNRSCYYRRQASLSQVERSFLSHLLIDTTIIPPPNNSSVMNDDDNDDDDRKASSSSSSSSYAVLNEDILFSLPTVGLIFSSSSNSSALDDIIASSSSTSSMMDKDSISRRRRSSIVAAKEEKGNKETQQQQQQQSSGLWKAYHHGMLRRRQRLGGRGKESRVVVDRTRRFWQRRERNSNINIGGEEQRFGTTTKDDAVISDDNDREKRKGWGTMNVGGEHSTNTSDAIDNDSSLLETKNNSNNNNSNNNNSNNMGNGPTTDKDINDDVSDNDNDIQSDNEVGTIHHDDSSASSWNSSQGGFDHFDAWEVLRDEYAPEFGFEVAQEEGSSSVIAFDQDDDNNNDVGDDNSQHRPFKILGTSAYDASALPHVLSPPLMDSLLNFVPEHLWNSNYWLKYSLVRDGASLDILRRYCRAATHTILAIETTNGDVFGSFTSSPWTCRRHRPSSSNTTGGGGFYGTGESFLWRMRSNRNTPVHSLFEQAQLESDIDIFPYNGSNDYVQLCTRDMLALGGGGVGSGGGDDDDGAKHPQPLDDDDAPPVVLEDIVNYGFGLALDKYLLHGTTSPSATFGNSNLTSHRSSIDNVVDGGVTFDVKNLEVWGFTSANTVADAQKSEMSMYFARESISSSMTSLSSFGTSRNSFGGRSDHQLFEADDLSQDRFYRRIGRDDENEVDRTAWQYANMMNPVAGSSPYGNMGSSSPFGR